MHEEGRSGDGPDYGPQPPFGYPGPTDPPAYPGPTDPPGGGPSGYGPPASSWPADGAPFGYGPTPGFGAPGYAGGPAPDGSGYGYGYATPVPAYKGSRLGLPPSGPYSLASPGQRLGARLLDGLITLPVLLIPMGILLASFVGDISVTPAAGPNQPAQLHLPPGLLVAAMLLFVVVLIGPTIWEAVATSVWGRTPGKAIVGIRAVRIHDDVQISPAPLSTGASWGRAAAVAALNLVGISLIDVLWCLWDQDRQCLHDKIVQTTVIVDPSRGRP
jgi:uncharacterized RDD family membrane protein YckC